MKLGISDKGLRRIAQYSLVDLWTLTLEDFLQNPLAGFEYDPTISNEANANDPHVITLGSKFFELDPGSRQHVIAHEKAHRDFDALSEEKGSALWTDLFNLADEGAFGPKYEDGTLDGINGQMTPMENLVEGLTVYNEEPEWLKENYPKVYDYIISNVKGSEEL